MVSQRVKRYFFIGEKQGHPSALNHISSRSARTFCCQIGPCCNGESKTLSDADSQFMR